MESSFGVGRFLNVDCRSDQWTVLYYVFLCFIFFNVDGRNDQWTVLYYVLLCGIF